MPPINNLTQIKDNIEEDQCSLHSNEYNTLESSHLDTHDTQETNTYEHDDSSCFSNSPLPLPPQIEELNNPLQSSGSNDSQTSCNSNSQLPLPPQIEELNSPLQPNGNNDDAEIILEESQAIEEGVEVVIDGVVIESNERSKKDSMYQRIVSCAVFCTTLLFLLNAFYFFRFASEPKSTYKNCSPSPSISISPTTFLTDYLKQLYIPISGEELLDDPTTIQHIAWKRQVGFTQFEDGIYFPPLNDTKAIVEIYILLVVGMSLSTRNKVEISNRPYNKDLNPCQIFECDDEGSVSIIVIRNERYSRTGGGILAKEIGYLSGLTHLILTNNDLVGTIPTEIGQLRNLHTLELQQNRFTGNIPTEIGEMRKLEWVTFGNNMLSGTIPKTIKNLNSVRYIDFSKNQLNGTVPTEIGTLGNLRGLVLNQNNLSGSVSFLCDSNITNETYLEEVYLGLSGIETYHTYNGTYGIVIDCEDNRPLLTCSCCICS